MAPRLSVNGFRNPGGSARIWPKNPGSSRVYKRAVRFRVVALRGSWQDRLAVLVAFAGADGQEATFEIHVSDAQLQVFLEAEPRTVREARLEREARRQTGHGFGHFGTRQHDWGRQRCRVRTVAARSSRLHRRTWRCRNRERAEGLVIWLLSG